MDMSLAAERILITGGRGYLGTKLAAKLKQMNKVVVLLDIAPPTQV